jgi:hypothetical protein
MNRSHNFLHLHAQCGVNTCMSSLIATAVKTYYFRLRLRKQYEHHFHEMPDVLIIQAIHRQDYRNRKLASLESQKCTPRRDASSDVAIACVECFFRYLNIGYQTLNNSTDQNASCSLVGISVNDLDSFRFCEFLENLREESTAHEKYFHYVLQTLLLTELDTANRN